MRFPLALLLGGVLLWGSVLCRAEEEKPDELITRLIPLEYLSAVQLSAAFHPATQAESNERLFQDRQEFLQRALTDATRGVRPLPSVMQQVGLYPFTERRYVETRVAQILSEQAIGDEGLAALLPSGLSEPPIAIADQNALLVRGTPRAIDQFRELIRLLDHPPQQVTIEVKLINFKHTQNEAWGLDLATRGPKGELFMQGPAPPGPSVHLLTDELKASLGIDRLRTRANSTTGASVTTQNNNPCLIRALTVIPVVVASVVFNAFGERYVDYTVDAVATGVELFVLPRINRDDTVTMFLQPRFIDATGQVVAPDGSLLPILDEVAMNTTIRVPDGETIVLGGLPSSLDALQAVGVPINFRETHQTEIIESLLCVTPHIVHFLNL
ncbi:MAG: type II secretion system protein GspD [Candidatus Zipacnadales bacterium]